MILCNRTYCCRLQIYDMYPFNNLDLLENNNIEFEKLSGILPSLSRHSHTTFAKSSQTGLDQQNKRYSISSLFGFVTRMTIDIA